MEAIFLEQKVHQLPMEAQQEVINYVDFLLYRHNISEPVKPYAGCMKGTFTWMSEDFNEPLEDFKDYM